jgi:hypothetical protein
LSIASINPLLGLVSRSPGQAGLGIAGVLATVDPVFVDASKRSYARDAWLEHEPFDCDSADVMPRLPTFAPVGIAASLATPKADGRKETWCCALELGESNVKSTFTSAAAEVPGVDTEAVYAVGVKPVAATFPPPILIRTARAKRRPPVVANVFKTHPRLS